MMAGVSVIICVRNGATYLGEALDSVAIQGMADVETIVIDDGSEDGTPDIARGHAIRPRVISRAPSGYGASLNAGLEEARRGFVAVLDADDVWPRTRLKEMLRAFEVAPAVQIVYGQMANTTESLAPKHAPFATRHLTCSLLRRGVFARVGPFRTDVKHASNIDWMSRAAALKIPMTQLDTLVLLRRVHSANLGVRDVTRGRQDLLRVVRDHHRRSKNA